MFKSNNLHFLYLIFSTSSKNFLQQLLKNNLYNLMKISIIEPGKLGDTQEICPRQYKW